MIKTLLTILFIVNILFVKGQSYDIVEFYSKKDWIRLNKKKPYYKRELKFINDSIWEVSDYINDTCLVVHGYVSSPTTKRKAGVFSFYENGILISKSDYIESQLQTVTYFKNNVTDTIIEYTTNCKYKNYHSIPKSEIGNKIIYSKKEYKYFFKEKVRIPPLAKHYWEQGQVCVRCVVNEHGEIINIEATGSAFSDLLSEAKRLVVDHIKTEVEVTSKSIFIIPIFFNI